MRLKVFLDALVELIYPPRCISCGKVIKTGYLCEDCKNIEYVTVRVCDKCGLTLNCCDCKKNAFHFDGLAAPFYNKGIAKNVVYSFKFRANADSCKFIAKSVAERIKERFPEFKCDVVCAVPMYWINRLRRGYNQSDMLARAVARELKVPYVKKSLIKARRTNTQHTLKYAQRFHNVRGVYKANKKFSGENVILIDDIRTTGATLNECARVLKRAGASAVVAATATIAQNYIEKKYKI